ncbi:hypothetical protein ACTFXU_27795, partial [Pseudomonas aeruginosa]
LPAFQHLARFEKATAQTPVAEQRQALREAGAPYQIWQVACRSSSFSLPPHVCAGMSSD